MEVLLKFKMRFAIGGTPWIDDWWHLSVHLADDYAGA